MVIFHSQPETLCIICLKELYHLPEGIDSFARSRLYRPNFDFSIYVPLTKVVEASRRLSDLGRLQVPPERYNSPTVNTLFYFIFYEKILFLFLSKLPPPPEPKDPTPQSPQYFCFCFKWLPQQSFQCLHFICMRSCKMSIHFMSCHQRTTQPPSIQP